MLLVKPTVTCTSNMHIIQHNPIGNGKNEYIRVQSCLLQNDQRFFQYLSK